MFEKQLVDIANRIREIQAQLQDFPVMVDYAGSPDGALEARESTLCWDTVNQAIYINVSVPQGTDWEQLCCPDPFSTDAFVVFDGVDDTPVTILAAGTITAVATFTYAILAVTAGDTAGGTVTLPVNDSATLYANVGATETFALAISAAGAVTVQRTAGADTFDIAIRGVWI